MKKLRGWFGLGCLLLVGLVTGCERKTAPLKEGVIWSVVWSPELKSQRGLFRVKTIPANGQPAGEYGVEMSGRLYPNFLKVQRKGEAHSQIIPMSQIISLEFGE